MSRPSRHPSPDGLSSPPALGPSLCCAYKRTINIVPFRKWLMRETGCTRIQAGISRAESRFARHDFETDGSIPRSGCELNPAFRKPKALRIVRAMKGAQGQAVPKVRRVFKPLPVDGAWNATRSERRA
jgi:hypothetical protein